MSAAHVRQQWLAEAKTRPVLQVAEQMGLQVRHGARPQLQCPACGASKRGSSDRRLPAVARDGRWNCWTCGARGDVVDLVALRLCSDRFRGQAQVRDWFAGPGASMPAVQAVEAPPLEYPPQDEVLDLWGRAGHPRLSPDLQQWLQGRLGEPWRRAAGVVRALPLRGPVPAWARFWRDRGYRALFPVFDAQGQMRSLRARRVADGPGPKCVPAMPPHREHPGFAAGGLVLACPLALGRLRGAALPPEWDQDPPWVVTEGEPAWLAWVAKRQAAVLGITSGSWSLPLADRIPDGALVIVATDQDKAGERYARQITESLRGRCRLRRWTPKVEK